MSTDLKNKMLDHVFKNAALSVPTDIYVCLVTGAASTDAAMGTECAGSGYARVQYNADWTAAASGALQNNSDITFPTATGDWGTITGGALRDAAAAGSYLGWCTLTASKTVNNGDTFKFATGDFDVSFTITA
jgi:hypothetical protein